MRGLAGQCAVEKKSIVLCRCGAGIHRHLVRASAEATRVSIVVLPVLFEGQTRAVIELATLQPFSAVNLAFLEQLTLNLGAVLNTIEATMRTEGLLTQSSN